jgi:hypothetical protein
MYEVKYKKDKGDDGVIDAIFQEWISGSCQKLEMPAE